MKTPLDTPEVLSNLAISAIISISPLVAEYLQPLVAAELLKASVADYMTRLKKMSKLSAATHMGLSERWIYKYLKRLPEHAQIEYPVRLDVITFFRRRDPYTASLVECQEWLHEQGRSTGAEELTNFIDAYCTLGYLERDGHRYRWKHSILSMDSTQLASRAERISQILPLVVNLLRGYLSEQDVMLRRINLRITRSAHEKMVEEIKRAVQEAMLRAVQRSNEEAPEGFNDDAVDVNGVICLGTTAISSS